MRLFFSVLVAFLIILSCATPRNPVGGEKDEKPPLLISSNPKDQSININTKEITLVFDEWIKVNDFKKQLIITPRTEIEYSQVTKRNELIIEFEKELADSTTYTLNFRKAIGDITEGNLWENPRIAFSTGPVLDTLSITGIVKDIKTNKAESDITVGLYNTKCDTCNLRQGYPLYLTTTDENGKYTITNIKKGNYKIQSFNDKNDDLINQSSTEPFGFYDGIIELDSNIYELNINLYQSNQDTLKIKNHKPDKLNYQINYNKGLKEYDIQPIDDSLELYSTLNRERNSLTVFKKNITNLDSTAIIIEAIDSINQKRKDTIILKYRESSISNDSISVLAKKGNSFIVPNFEYTYSFNKPVTIERTDSVYILYDSIILKQLYANNLKTTDHNNILSIKANVRSNQIDSIKQLITKYEAIKDSIDTAVRMDSTKATDTVATVTDERNTSEETDSTQNANRNKFEDFEGLTLYLQKGTLVSFDGEALHTLKEKVKVKKSENYGIIRGKVDSITNEFIVQLVNNKYELIDEIRNEKEFLFNYVEPGNYYLRLIIDHNKNGKWDPGFPLLNKAEEPIIYMENELIVKANWELIDKNFIVDKY